MKAKVAHFYGWTDEYIMSMPYRTFNEYYIATVPLAAEKLLGDIQVSTYPHMNKTGRQKIFAKLRRTANNYIRKATSQAKNVDDAINRMLGKANHGG